MKGHHHHHRLSFSSLVVFTIFFLPIAFNPLGSASTSLSKDTLGIAPQDANYFKPDIIKCKDGSKKFTKAQLNDDFCDCPDGTDEPGTSACPGGKFYCHNAGHIPLLLFSSRVNDGLCDCCDGSDEYNGRLTCPNTCWEAGKVARDKLKKKIATYQEGVTIRKYEVEQARKAIAKAEAELSKLKSEEKILKGLVQQLQQRKEQIEKAEEKERLEKEKEEKRKRESEEKADYKEKLPTEAQDGANQDDVGTFDESSGEQAEEKERLEKEKEEKRKRESEEKADDKEKIPTEAQDGANQDHVGTFDESSGEQDVKKLDDDAAVEAENDGKSKTQAVDDELEQHAADDNSKTRVEAEHGHDVGSSPSGQPLEKEKDGSETAEELSREELGRLVASRWTGENAGQETKEVSSDTKEEERDGTQDNKHDEDYDGYSSETDEEHDKSDEDDIDVADMDDEVGEQEDHDSSVSYEPESDDLTDFSDISTTSDPSWLGKIQRTVRNILQAVNLFQTPIDKSEAAHVRKEYDDSSKKLSKLQSRISSLDQKLKHDLGTEKEFYSFYNRCFEIKQNKYVYKVCPFKEASQVEGHSTTQLGRWDKFEESYSLMIFANGDKCWNGPDRSLKVKLRCGLKNELSDVDEPSRCEYVALMSTPALCLEDKLKELQRKLDSLNSEQPQSRDEL